MGSLCSIVSKENEKRIEIELLTMKSRDIKHFTFDEKNLGFLACKPRKSKKQNLTILTQ